MNILYFIRCHYRKLLKKNTPLRTVVVEEVPDSIEPGAFYLLGKGQKPWAAVFQCPCRCDATIELNLLAETRPCWRVRRHWDSSPSLWPSVNGFVGCRSHFWLEKGLIRWAFNENDWKYNHTADIGHHWNG
jgi:hypothetical protein